MKKPIFRWAKVLILVYSIIGIAFYYLQEKLIFHPAPMARDEKYQFDQPFKEINIPYNQDVNLNIVQFMAVDTVAHPSKGVILYFHGNKNNIGWYARHVPDFTHKGYEVWMMDYPGFGKTTGTMTEQKLYDYALQLYKLARSRYTPQQIIIYGKSLGTGIATQLASVRDCRRLILECPYYSMTSLIRHYLPVWPVGSMLHYKLPTYEFMPEVAAPVTLFEGTGDWLVPMSNAARLKPLLKKGDEFISIEGGGHNDLGTYPLFHQKLDSVLAL